MAIRYAQPESPVINNYYPPHALFRSLERILGWAVISVFKGTGQPSPICPIIKKKKKIISGLIFNVNKRNYKKAGSDTNDALIYTSPYHRKFSKTIGFEHFSKG